MIDKQKMCLTCPKDARNRGLCPSCYNSAVRRVRAGITTWTELESMGLSLPASKRGGLAGPWIKQFEAKTLKAWNSRKIVDSDIDNPD